MTIALAPLLALAMISAPVSASVRDTDARLNMMARRRREEAAPVAAEDVIGDLERVHRKVNALGLLDCKASVYEKLRRLIAYGIDHRRARFIAVRTETGGHHAIAVVDNHYALDNRRDFVTTIEDLRSEGYSIAALN